MSVMFFFSLSKMSLKSMLIAQWICIRFVFFLLIKLVQLQSLEIVFMLSGFCRFLPGCTRHHLDMSVVVCPEPRPSEAHIRICRLCKCLDSWILLYRWLWLQFYHCQRIHWCLLFWIPEYSSSIWTCCYHNRSSFWASFWIFFRHQLDAYPNPSAKRLNSVSLVCLVVT